MADQRDREVRNLFLIDDIDDKSVKPIIEKIFDFNQKDIWMFNELKDFQPEPIRIFISSNGGRVFSGMALIAAMEASSTPIITIASGMIASMGLIIFATGTHRLAHRYTRFMYHQAANGEWGKLETHRRNVEELDYIQNLIDKHLGEYTKIPKEIIEDAHKSLKDIYFDANKAKEWGVVDEIIEREIISEDAEGNVTPESIAPKSKKLKKKKK